MNPPGSDGRTARGTTWFEPGQWVRHPGQPEWGVGQVQSVIGSRVTVNFPHVGKILVNTAIVPLEPADAE